MPAIAQKAKAVDFCLAPPKKGKRNREYLIRRSTLGENPTQDEIDAVVAYGLEQHRINFPRFMR